MEAPQITKLTREDIDRLFSVEPLHKVIGADETDPLARLGLIEEKTKNSYVITKAGKARLKRERILRDREARYYEVRRAELEATRQMECDSDRKAAKKRSETKVIKSKEKSISSGLPVYVQMEMF